MKETPDDAVVRPPSVVGPLVFAAIIVACVALVRFTPLRELTSGSGVEDLRGRIADLGPAAPAVFVGGVAIGVAVGVPRLALAALAGALFGVVEGAALSQVGTIVGCLLTFSLGRGLARDWVGRVATTRFPRIETLRAMIGRHGFAANLLLRTAPVGNCFATNLLMSVSPVSTRDFLLGTFVGTLPETVIFALFGSAAGGDGATTRLVVGAALFATMALVVAFFVRRSRLARTTSPVENGALP